MSSRPDLKLLLATACLLFAASPLAAAGRPAKSTSTAIDSQAFRGAIVIDAATGNVLFEDRADLQTPPASVTKLMTFAIVSDKLRDGSLTLSTPVAITAEAAKTGGSQVWLVDKENITVEELLYALMVKSANDAAVALAIHIAGSKEAFVDLMNIKAQQLGLHNTLFRSPHGLPPSKGDEPDLSTARDIALLARKLITETDILKYTSARHHTFRHQNGQVNELDNHNHLLNQVAGCDGLKTGWYVKAGYCLAATVQRNNRRIITVILGSPERLLRDKVTTQLIARGFATLPPEIPKIAGAAAQAPVPSGVQPSAAASTPGTAKSAPAAGDATPLKLAPVTDEEKSQLSGAGSAAGSETSVHFSISSPKK